MKKFSTTFIAAFAIFGSAWTICFSALYKSLI